MSVCVCVCGHVSRAVPAEITREVLKASKQVEMPGRNNKTRIYCLVASRRRERPIQCQCVLPLVLPSTLSLPTLLLPPSAAGLLADIWKGVVKNPFKRGFPSSSSSFLPPARSPQCVLISFQLSVLLLETPAGFPIPSGLPPCPFHEAEVINQIPAISPELPASGAAAAGILPHQAAQETFRAGKL